MSKESRVGRLEEKLRPQYESVTLFCDKEHAPAPQDYVRAALAETEGFPTIIVRSFLEGGEARHREVMQKLEQARKEVQQ